MIFTTEHEKINITFVPITQSPIKQQFKQHTSMKTSLSLLLITMLLLSLNTKGQEHKRIVSLAASITNNLYLLGVQDRIVGRTQYCYIAEKDNIPIVADAVNANIEKIVSLKPDIVIASGLTHPKIISALQKMGLKTVHWYQPKDFNEICNQLEELGKICGKSTLASSYVRESRERLKTVQAIKKNRNIRIFMEQGIDPLFTVLPNSFMNDYILLLGGTNICEKMKTGMVSREFVLANNPDVIIIVSMGQHLGEEEQKKWALYKSLKAAQNRKIFVVEADQMCVPTPISFMDALEKLAKQIYQ